MPANMTNSVVGALIEQVEHKCKYNDQGCQVKMMLKDLVAHEKLCPERLFNCPFFGCNQLVKLKSFDTHALGDDVKHSTIVGGNCLTWKITENDVHLFDWGMGCIQALDELFHVSLAYHKPSNCFVFCIWLAKSQNIASKYEANLVIKGDGNKRLCFDGIKVNSVKSVPSIEKCIEETGNISLCLPRNLAKNISEKRQERIYEFQSMLFKTVIKESLNVDYFFKKI